MAPGDAVRKVGRQVLCGSGGHTSRLATSRCWPRRHSFVALPLTYTIVIPNPISLNLRLAYFRAKKRTLTNEKCRQGHKDPSGHQGDQIKWGRLSKLRRVTGPCPWWAKMMCLHCTKCLCAACLRSGEVSPGAELREVAEWDGNGVLRSHPSEDSWISHCME